MAAHYTYTVQDSIVSIRDTDNNLITQFNIPAEDVRDLVIQDSTVSLKRTDNSVINTISLKVEEDKDYIINDSIITLTDQNDNIIDTIQVMPNVTDTIQLNIQGGVGGSGTIHIRDTQNQILYTREVLAGTTINQVINNSNIKIKNTTGVDLFDEDLRAESDIIFTILNSNVDIIRTDQSIITNQHIIAQTQNNIIMIHDSYVNIKDSGNNVIDIVQVKADSTTDYILDSNLTGQISIKDTADNILYQQNVAPGSSVSKTIQDSKIRFKVNNSISDLYDQVYDILAEENAGTKQFIVPKTKVKIKIVDNNNIVLETVDYTDLISGVRNTDKTINVNVDTPIVCPNVIYGIFNEDEKIMPPLTIIEELAGVYECVDTDETLIYKVNNVTVTLPITLVENDVLIVERIDDSSDGYFKLKTDC